MIVDRFSIYGSPTYYVTTVDATDEERQNLILNGFAPYRSRRIEDCEDPDFGKKVVLWEKKE